MLELRIQQHFIDSADLKYQAAQALSKPIAAAVQAILACVTSGGKVLACGNGGSAADAQHFAAEFVGRFERERPELAAVALSANAALLTATTTHGDLAQQFAAEANKNVVSSLAYQHYEQDCGYWPSSTQSAFDKRNIRDGHYFIWSPIHFFAKVDGAGVPTNPKVAEVFDLFAHDTTKPKGIDMLTLEITSGTVPQCAMEVKREADLGPMQSYLPDEPCGCFFEKTATGATTCQECVDDDACPASASHCRFGFCEVN